MLTVAAGAVCSAFLYLKAEFTSPAGTDPTERIVEILHGEGLSLVTRRLEGEGLLKHPLFFRIMARWMGDDRRIKNGEYAFSQMKSPKEILSDLVQGKVRLFKVAIPEGFTLQQIAGAVEKSGLATSVAFLSMAKSPAMPEKMGIQSPTLEGYLFPDTYLFDKRTTVEEMIAAMATRFRSVFTDSWRLRAKELGLGVHEVVTLASIVEKETGAAGERPLIAAVFYNRLKLKMRLESDPTVIYGIDGFGGDITREHLKTVTPYNTYQIQGLPPTPIASPGKAAMEAVLYPADVPYLYFVSKGDGTHLFSLSLEEHNRAVRAYQLIWRNGSS